MRRAFSTVALLFALFAAPVAADETVRLERKDHTVSVLIGDAEFTVYYFDPAQPKPYFSPVRAAGGAIVSRGLENPEDHPHHKGIWCAIDEVNEVKYWAEQGKIVSAEVRILEPQGNPAKMRVVNHWLAKDGSPAVVETVDVSIYPSRLLVYDLQFTAGKEPVTFRDTKEGLFGIRVADTLRGKASGHIVNAEGLVGEKDCWGKESKWVDYFGDVGGQVYGVALFDDPGNFRRSRFHVRDYGLFTLSPFGQHAYTNGALPEDPLTLEPGKSVRLRYGIYIHEGDTQAGRVAPTYEFFLKQRG